MIDYHAERTRPRRTRKLTWTIIRGDDVFTGPLETPIPRWLAAEADKAIREGRATVTFGDPIRRRPA